MIVALLDHLWQSTLFVAAVGLLTILLRKNSAGIRYWLWFAASAKFLIPFSLLTVAGSYLLPPLTAASFVSAPSVPPLLYAMQPAAQPFSVATPVLSAPAATGLNVFPIVLALWVLGFVAISTISVYPLVAAAHGIAQRGEFVVGRAGAGKILVVLSGAGLVGIWRPVLLLPEGIVARLSPEEMQSVLAHELCHLRRRDNLTAAIHMLVAALFWFYPLIWWIGARLIDERERACDESVLESGNDAQIYAEGILKVCRFYVHSPLTCAAGVLGADLKRRVEAIMTDRIAIPLGLARKILLVASAIAAIGVPLSLGFLLSPMAVAQTADETAAIPTPEEQAQMLAEQQKPRSVIPFDPALFDKYVGYYQSGPIEIFTVTRDSDRFFVQLTGGRPIEIYPDSDSEFFTTVFASQISFNTDMQGNVTELVVHEYGIEQHAKRIDEAQAKSIEAALQQRIKSNTPSPGTKESILRYIASLQNKVPNFDEMTPLLADDVRPVIPSIEDHIAKCGALKSITFERVNSHGWDMYRVGFVNGSAEWQIAPLTPDGKVEKRGFVANCGDRLRGWGSVN